MSGLAATTAAALTDALREQQSLYESLLQVAGQEERAIVGGDVRALTELTEEKERLIELLATLETERMTAITAIAAATGIDAGTLTITRVASILPAEQAAALTAAGDDLREQALDVKQANDSNAALLRSSSEIVGRWIQYLRTVISGSLTYTAEGSPGESGGNRVIDRSA